MVHSSLMDHALWPGRQVEVSPPDGRLPLPSAVILIFPHAPVSLHGTYLRAVRLPVRSLQSRLEFISTMVYALSASPWSAGTDAIICAGVLASVSFASSPYHASHGRGQSATPSPTTHRTILSRLAVSVHAFCANPDCASPRSLIIRKRGFTPTGGLETASLASQSGT